MIQFLHVSGVAIVLSTLICASARGDDAKSVDVVRSSGGTEIFRTAGGTEIFRTAGGTEIFRTASGTELVRLGSGSIEFDNSADADRTGFVGGVGAPSKRLRFASTYQHSPVDFGIGAGGFRGIAILGNIGDGSGIELTLDPNTCQVDEFGDRGVCTKIALTHIFTTLRRLRLADPKGYGRAIYRMESNDFPKSLVVYLVVAPNEAACRMVLSSPDAETAIALERDLGITKYAGLLGNSTVPIITQSPSKDAGTDTAVQALRDNPSLVPNRGYVVEGTSRKLSLKAAYADAVEKLKALQPDSADDRLHAYLISVKSTHGGIAGGVETTAKVYGYFDSEQNP